jgi:hypothetical protein
MKRIGRGWRGGGGRGRAGPAACGPGSRPCHGTQESSRWIGRGESAGVTAENTIRRRHVTGLGISVAEIGGPDEAAAQLAWAPVT